MQIHKIAYKCKYIRLHTNANATDFQAPTKCWNLGPKSQADPSHQEPA